MHECEVCCPSERLRLVEDEAQNYDVILGRNFTDLSQFVYYRYDNRFEFIDQKDFPVRNYPEIDVKDQIPDKPEVLESTCLPPASINFVQDQVKHVNPAILSLYFLHLRNLVTLISIYITLKTTS